jgi:hypothetical protein
MPEIFRWKSRSFELNLKKNPKNETSETLRLTRMFSETSVDLSVVSVDFSERNASVAKTRNFELLAV